MKDVPVDFIKDKCVKKDLNHLSSVYSTWISSHSMTGLWNELQLLFQLLYSTTDENPPFLKDSLFKESDIVLTSTEKSILAAKTLNHLRNFVCLMIDTNTLNTIKLRNSLLYSILPNNSNDIDEYDDSKRLEDQTLSFNVSKDSSNYCSHHPAELLYHNRQKIQDLFYDFLRKHLPTPDSQFVISITDFTDKQSILRKMSQSIQELWSVLHRGNIRWFADFFLTEYLFVSVHQILYPSTINHSNSPIHPNTDTLISSKKLGKLEARLSRPSNKQIYLLLKRKQGKKTQKDLFLYFLDHVDSYILNIHLTSAVCNNVIEKMALDTEHLTPNQEMYRNDPKMFSKEMVGLCKEKIVECVQLGRLLSYLHTNALDYVEDKWSRERIDFIFSELLSLFPDPFESSFVFLMFLAFLSAYTRSFSENPSITGDHRSIRSIVDMLLESYQRISGHMIREMCLSTKNKVWVVSMLWIEDILENLSVGRPFVKDCKKAVNHNVSNFDVFFIDIAFMKLHFELFSQFQIFLQPFVVQDDENRFALNNGSITSTPIRIIKPALIINQVKKSTTNKDLETQKSLRQWFYRRYPKLKECIDSLVNIIPEFSSEEILYNSSQGYTSIESDADDIHVFNEREHTNSECNKIMSLKDYQESTRKRVMIILKSICPPHTSEEVIRISTMLAMEKLDPELERRYMLVHPLTCDNDQ